MPLAGIRLVRQIFSDLLPKGYSVTSAYLNYHHNYDNMLESQVLTFHVIDPAGVNHVIQSDEVRSREDVGELAKKAAQKFTEGLSHGPPDGSDEHDSQQRPAGAEDQKDTGG